MSKPDGEATAPPPSRVRGNDWRDLEPPRLGAWQPSRAVSVVIPYYDRPDALRLVLVALTAQTYPLDLIQVVIADDGSDPVYLRRAPTCRAGRCAK